MFRDENIARSKQILSYCVDCDVSSEITSATMDLCLLQRSIQSNGTAQSQCYSGCRLVS
jgi:hypothetical protein